MELTVTPVLGDRFVRLHWVNNGGKEGRQPFEGLAIYEERPDGTLAATWWDSQGARHRGGQELRDRPWLNENTIAIVTGRIDHAR